MGGGGGVCGGGVRAEGEWSAVNEQTFRCFLIDLIIRICKSREIFDHINDDDHWRS